MVVCNVNSSETRSVIIFHVNVVHFAVDGIVAPAHVVGIIFACEVSQDYSKDGASCFTTFWALKE